MLFNTTLILYDISLQNYGNLTLKYIFENEDFSYFEFYVKCTLCGLTLFVLILWIWYGLSGTAHKDLIAEQRWMIVLFFAVLLYQDPLTVGLFATDSFDVIYLVSSIFFATSVNLFMIYWSLMIDSIREIKFGSFPFVFLFPKCNVIRCPYFYVFRNLIDVGVTFGCQFYRGKLIAILISYISSLVFTCCTQYMIEHNETGASYNEYFLQHFESPLVVMVVISGVIWLMSVFIFICWLLKSLWNANKELNALPYIETRERQLSLRVCAFLCIALFSIIIPANPQMVTRSSSISHSLSFCTLSESKYMASSPRDRRCISSTTDLPIYPR